MSNDRWISTTQASRKWGCSAWTVSCWCRDGIIPEEYCVQYRKGSRWRIRADCPCPKLIVRESEQ